MKKQISTAEFFETRDKYNKRTDEIRRELRKVEQEYTLFLSKYHSQSTGGWGS